MPKHIVIANDSQEMCDLYRDILALEGYKTHYYSISDHSLPGIESAHPDLILIDYIFGIEEVGWQMLCAIKRHPVTASLPVILCTTMVDEVQKQEAFLYSHGVKVVLKPFELDELLGAIHYALDHG